jgi:hypothetical protein
MERLIAGFFNIDTFTTVTVYGEIYGGLLNGETAQGSKKVQEEVQYSPETQFAAFDIVIDGKYLSQGGAFALLDMAGFHKAPLIGIYYSLEDALAVPNDLQSRVPEMLGYEVTMYLKVRLFVLGVLIFICPMVVTSS